MINKCKFLIFRKITKKDMKLGVSLTSKSVTKEMTKEVTDLEVENEVTAIDDLGNGIIVMCS